MAYLDELCDRCGSKRVLSKRHDEILVTYSGKSTVKVAQIICINDTCQKLFDENVAKMHKKSEEIKEEKAKQEAIRRENIQKTRMTNQASGKRAA